MATIHELSKAAVVTLLQLFDCSFCPVYLSHYMTGAHVLCGVIIFVSECVLVG